MEPTTPPLSHLEYERRDLSNESSQEAGNLGTGVPFLDSSLPLRPTASSTLAIPQQLDNDESTRAITRETITAPNRGRSDPSLQIREAANETIEGVQENAHLGSEVELRVRNLHSEGQASGLTTHETINEKMAKCIVSGTSPITGLPALRAQELAYIGQSVSFIVETTTEDESEPTEWMHYEGLISMVTATSLSLVNVTRFTRADYNYFVAQRERTNEQEQQRDDPFFNPTTLASMGARKSVGNRSSNAEPHPFAPLCHIMVPDKQEVKKPVTMGPFPFISFFRKGIINVEFIPSPSSSSFALFCDSSSRIMDMQYLRIFVRRYLVHMSNEQKSSLQNMTLKEYIASRGNAAEIDVDLLEKVAREELRYLLEANEKILKAQGQSFRHRGELDVVGGESAARELLISTGIPQYTITTATVMGMALLCGLLYSLFFLYGVSKPRVITIYLVENWESFFLGFLFSTPAIVVIGYHGATMTPPRSTQIGISVLRILATLGALMVIVLCFLFLQNLYRESTAEQFYIRQREEGRECAFFRELHCSGWAEPNILYAALKCNETVVYPMACNSPFLIKVRMIIVPVMISQAVMLLTACVSLGLLIFMFYYMHEIYHRRVRRRGVNV